MADPEPLSNMVTKLLAKNAEERYQTASGLEADLRRRLAEWRSHGRIDPFPLGLHDVPDRLLIPEKLYGREREVGLLLAAFDRVKMRGKNVLEKLGVNDRTEAVTVALRRGILYL
jgi:hypothetical protein